MTQRLYPNGDVDSGVWARSSGSTFYGLVDEAVDSNDGDATFVETDTTDSVLKLALLDGTKPAELTGHFIRFAWNVDGVASGDTTMKVELRQGGSLVATATDVIALLAPHGYETVAEYNLTPDEVGLLSNYADLEMWASSPDVGFGTTVRITAIEYRIPDGEVIKEIVYGYI